MFAGSGSIVGVEGNLDNCFMRTRASALRQAMLFRLKHILTHPVWFVKDYERWGDGVDEGFYESTNSTNSEYNAIWVNSRVAVAKFGMQFALECFSHCVTKDACRVMFQDAVRDVMADLGLTHNGSIVQRAFADGVTDAANADWYEWFENPHCDPMRIVRAREEYPLY